MAYSLLPPCRSRGLSSGWQAWQQAPSFWFSMILELMYKCGPRVRYEEMSKLDFIIVGGRDSYTPQHV